MCIDGYNYGSKVTTPQQNEKTRMVLSLPKMNDNEQNNNKVVSGSGIRTETNSVNESTGKRSQLTSIHQLKNAMRIMPEVRPIAIHNRHVSSAASGPGTGDN